MGVSVSSRVLVNSLRFAIVWSESLEYELVIAAYFCSF